MAVPAKTDSKRTGYNSVGIKPASHIPKSVNQPNSTERGICKSCISLNCFRRMRICPKIKTQFHKNSQVPSENTGNCRLTTLATDEIGDTPSSPCLVTATPSPEKNNPIINNTYRFTVSLCNLTKHTTSDCAVSTGERLYLRVTEIIRNFLKDENFFFTNHAKQHIIFCINIHIPTGKVMKKCLKLPNGLWHSR